MHNDPIPPEQPDENAHLLDQEALEITAKTAKIDASTRTNHDEQDNDEGEIAHESAPPNDTGELPEAEKNSDATTAIWIAPTNSFYRDYWKEFRLFGSSCEEWSFRHWYLVPLVFFALLIIIDSNLDLRQGIDLFAVLSQGSLYTKAIYSFTLHDITSPYLLLALIAFACTGFAFDRWGKSIPILLWRLYTLGRIFSRTTKQKVTQDEYLRFLAQYQQALLNWKRLLWLGAVLLLTLGLLVLVVPAQIAAVAASPAPDGFSVVLEVIRWPFFLIVLASLLLAYYMTEGLWVMIITGWFLLKLTRQFHFMLQPHHMDRCGGLRLLGRFCLGLALPILTATSFLGIYGIALVLATGGTSIFLEIANLLLCLATLVFCALAFFGPVWHIHQRMVARKAESDEDSSLMLVLLETKLRAALHQGDLEKARSARAELKLLQTLHPEQSRYPAWPFDRRLLLAYALPQLLPLLSLLVALNAHGLFANAIRGLWSLLAGHPLP